MHFQETDRNYILEIEDEENAEAMLAEVDVLAAVPLLTDELIHARCVHFSADRRRLFRERGLLPTKPRDRCAGCNSSDQHDRGPLCTCTTRMVVACMLRRT